MAGVRAIMDGVLAEGAMQHISVVHGSVQCIMYMYDTRERYDTRCYFNVHSKADISQLNLPHGIDN